MFTININIVMGYNQLARIYRGMGHHGIIRVLRIIFKGHGRAFEGIFLGEGHHESMAVGLPSQRVAFAEINILWTCPINRHYRHTQNCPCPSHAQNLYGYIRTPQDTT